MPTLKLRYLATMAIALTALAVIACGDDDATTEPLPQENTPQAAAATNTPEPGPTRVPFIVAPTDTQATDATGQPTEATTTTWVVGAVTPGPPPPAPHPMTRHRLQREPPLGPEPLRRPSNPSRKGPPT